MPDPYTTYHDSESMLKFLIEEIGVHGKIGCMGRSLGGTSESNFLGDFSRHIYLMFSRNWIV